MKTKLTRGICYLSVVFIAMTDSGQAAITNTALSSAFAYQYEMDTAPNNQDLDSNVGDDWFDSGVPTVSGGFAANTGGNQLYRGDFGGPNSIWRTVNSPASADWTLEVRVAKTGGTQGADGWFGIATANASESNSSRLNIEDDRISLGGVGDYLIGTDFSTGAYHTIRIVHDAVDNTFYYWVDGTLLNADVSTPINGGNGSGFDNSIFIADFSGGLAGNYSIDYIRLDPDAYAPKFSKADNTTNLNEGVSWVPGGAPGASQVAVWDSTVTAANSVSLGANASWQGLRIEDPGGDVTISGANTLTLGSDGLDTGSNQDLVYMSSGTLDLNGPLAGSTELILSNNATLNWTGMGASTFTGTMRLRGGSGGNWIAFGTPGTTQTGSFGLDTGANTSDERSFVLTDAWGNGTGARPKLSLSSLSGTGNFRTDWGSTGAGDRPRTISVDQSIDTTFNGYIDENNNSTRQIGLEKLGSGKLTLGSYSDHTGGTTIRGGTLQMERADSIGVANNGTSSVTVEDGTLDLSFDGTAGSYASATTHFTALFNTLTLGGASGATPTVLTSGTVGSGAALGIANSIIYDASNDPGSATIPGRFITVGTSGVSSREIAVGDSAATTTELEISGQMGRVGNGDGEETTIRKTGAGTLKISGQNNFPVLQIEGGKVVAAHAQALGVTKVLANSLIMTNGTLEAGDAARSFSTPVVLSDAATGTISGDTHQLTLSGGISGGGALVKTGAATLVASGVGSFTGGTTIEGGRVDIERADSLGVANLAAATTEVTVKDGILDLSFDGSAGSYASATLNFTALWDTLTLGGAAGATPTVLTSGTVGSGASLGIENRIVYDAANDPGTATISGRWITVGNHASQNSREIAVGDSAATTTELEISGQMSATGQNDGRYTMIRKTGDGTLKITGANNFPELQIEGGTLVVNNSQALGINRSDYNQVIVSNGTLELNGFSPTIGGLNDAGGTGGSIVNNGGGASTLTVGSSWSGADTDYSGTIEDGSQAVALTKLGAGILTLDGNNTYSGATTINGGGLRIGSGGTSGTLGSAAVTLTSGDLRFNRSDDVTVANDISGGGNLVQEGAGKTTLTSDNSYTGTTDVEGGMLEIGSGGATGDIGSGAVTVDSGATLRFNRTGTLNYKATAKMRNVSGAGDIELDGGVFVFNYTGAGTGFNEGGNSWTGLSGDLRILGGSEFQTIRNGATAMGTGTIQLGDGSGNGYLSQIEGNWTWTNPIDSQGAANEIRNRATGSSRRLKLQGAIGGSGGLTLTDTAGSMTDAETGFILTGANTLSGSLTVDAPVRVGGVPGDDASTSAGTSGSLGAASVTVNASETLTFSRTDSHVNSAAIGGAGNLRVGLNTGTGSQVVRQAAAGTYTGMTTIDAGTLIVGSGGTAGSLGSGAVALNAGELHFDRSDSITVASAISGGGSLVQAGSGVTILTANNSYSGTTIVSNGMLQVGNGGTTGSFGSGAVTIASGAELRRDRSNIADPIANEITGSGTFSLRGGSAAVGSFSGNWVRFTDSDSGGFHLDMGASLSDRGDLILNEIWGDGTSRPKLELASLSGYGYFRSDWGSPGGTEPRTISVNQSVDTTYSGQINAHAAADREIALEKLGSGTLTLTADNDYDGGTTVSGGTLMVNNASGTGTGGGVVTAQTGATLGGTGTVGGVATIESGGTLAPGASAGTLTFSAGLTLDAGSTLSMELGTSSDLVRVSGGTLTGPASGLVSINVTDGGGFTDGVYTLIDWTGATASSVDLSDFSLTVPVGTEYTQLLIDGTTLVLNMNRASVFTFR